MENNTIPLYDSAMYPLMLFFVTNVLLFSWLTQFHSLIPFAAIEYQNNAHHYIEDTRISKKQFVLSNALGQYDSQWYIKIADKGYPYKPAKPDLQNVTQMEGILYNFFPLVPLLITTVNFVFHNVELSAFFYSNIVLLAICHSLYFVTNKWFSKKVAQKTLLLFLVFPFSIFLRGYYSEGLRLLFFIWFCYGLTQKKYVLSGITVSLMAITNGSALFLLPFYWVVLGLQWLHKKIALKKMSLLFIISLLPFTLWMVFCSIQTGDPLIFTHTIDLWQRPPFFPLLYNLLLIFALPVLPVRAFYGAQLDVMMIVFVFGLLYLSRNVLPRLVWVASFVVFLTPLTIQDSISTLRFSIMQFPLIIFLAFKLKNIYFWLLWLLFVGGMLWISLLYSNWYWVE